MCWQFSYDIRFNVTFKTHFAHFDTLEEFKTTCASYERDCIYMY